MTFVHLIQSASSLPTDASALESSISALERQITSLENLSVPWENWLPWFTALVAIGVAMEFWVIWRERRDDTEAWKRGTTLRPERPSTAKFVLEFVSLVLITGGIVGELGIGIKITSINGQLRAMNAELRSKGDQLVGLLHVEASNAERDAATAHRIAESEKLARVKIEKQLAPRTISESDREKIGKDLRKFAPSFSDRKIRISSLVGDAEGIVFSLEIMDIVARAGIDVDPIIGRVEQVGLVDMGVKITGPAADQEFMKALAGDIRADCDTSLHVEWGPQFTQVEIAVRVKPVAGLPTVFQRGASPK